MKTDKESLAVAICETHQKAEQVVKELQRSGFEIKKLSIVGRDYYEEEKVVGFYNIEDAMKNWGKAGVFWGGVWGYLFGAGFFMIPGIGPLVMAGPIVSSIVGALEGALVVGGLSAFGAALFSLGIPKDSVLRYEKELRADKYLVIAHGSQEDIDKVRFIMNNNNEIEVAIHH